MRYTRPMSWTRLAAARSLALAAALVVVWEGSKALFALPTYMLPHVHEILASSGARGRVARRGS